MRSLLMLKYGGDVEAGITEAAAFMAEAGLPAHSVRTQLEPRLAEVAN